LVTVAITLCVLPVCTDAVVGLTATAMGGAGTTVNVAAAVLVVSVTDCAVNVTEAGVGTAAGAVYVIEAPEALEAADKVPHVAPLQPAPVKVHVTPLFCVSLVTVAMMFCALLVCTDALVGLTATETGGGGTTVNVATALFVVSVTDCAVSVTVAGTGTAAGAV
jgi:hypothetical protein